LGNTCLKIGANGKMKLVRYRPYFWYRVRNQEIVREKRNACNCRATAKE
jgi:hypothetical protein